MARLHYAWVVAGVIFGAIVVAGGVRSTPALVLKSLEAEFGWSNALISGAVSINIFLYGIVGPFAAALMDTVGMRACILAAFLLMFCGIATATVMTSAWHLYILWGVLVGLACGVIAPVLGKVTVNRWFVSHAGLMMGVFSAAAQTGQVVLAPLLGFLVATYGWRGAAWTMAAVAGAASLPVAFLLRERPSDLGLKAVGAPPVSKPSTLSESAAKASATGPGVDDAPGEESRGERLSTPEAQVKEEALKQPPQPDDAPLLCDIESTHSAAAMASSLPDSAAAESPSVAAAAAPPDPVSPFLLPLVVLRELSGQADFWLIAASFFVCGASTNGLIAVHLIPACIDRGIPEVQAAGFLAGIGVFDIVGTVASGLLTDRFDARVLLAIYYAFRGIALVLLPWALSLGLAGMWPFAVLFGLDWVATVPPTAALCSACFGARRSAIAFAWCLCCHQIGAAVIAAVAGVLRTELGSYEWAFWSSGALCVATAAVVLCIQCGTAPLPLLPTLCSLRSPREGAAGTSGGHAIEEAEGASRLQQAGNLDAGAVLDSAVCRIELETS